MKSGTKVLSPNRLLVMLAVAVGMSGGSVALGANSRWTDNFAAATKAAAKTHKMVLLDFTGSDWCPYCIELTKDVFSTPAFNKWAANRFVLVDVDFPQQKEQSAAVKQQNEKLKDEYDITGFPTVVILNSSGKELTRSVGYDGAGATDWIKARDEEIAKAQGK